MFLAETLVSVKAGKFRLESSLARLQWNPAFESLQARRIRSIAQSQSEGFYHQYTVFARG